MSQKGRIVEEAERVVRKSDRETTREEDHGGDRSCSPWTVTQEGLIAQQVAVAKEEAEEDHGGDRSFSPWTVSQEGLIALQVAVAEEEARKQEERRQVGEELSSWTDTQVRQLLERSGEVEQRPSTSRGPKRGWSTPTTSSSSGRPISLFQRRRMVREFDTSENDAYEERMQQELEDSKLQAVRREVLRRQRDEEEEGDSEEEASPEFPNTMDVLREAAENIRKMMEEHKTRTPTAASSSSSQ